MVDVPLIIHPDKKKFLDELPSDPRRRVVRCGAAHKNFGNTCRHKAWNLAQGDYILYLDDDNYLAPDSLKQLDAVTDDWAIFPMLRHGSRFYNDPPAFGGTDTGNMLIKREHGQWPNVAGYAADWELADRLMKSHAYQALPDIDPVVVMEVSNRGK